MKNTNQLRVGITGTKTYENKLKIKEFIHGLRTKTDKDVVVVGLGDLYGADKWVKRYALELGYKYQEANPPHTPQNLYSILPESHYDQPFNVKNMRVRDKIYVQYIDLCAIFDDSQGHDVKVNSLLNELKKQKRKHSVIA